MRRAVKMTAVAASAVLALSAAGCGGKKASTGGGGGGDGKKIVKVGLAYDVGGRGDKSFNDAAYAGLQKVQSDLKLDVKDIEAKEGESDNDKIQRLQLLAQSGYNPVIAVGFAYAGALGKVAPKFPNTKFAIIDDNSVQQPNVADLLFAENEGSYLVGAAAAKKSKTGHIGFIGGVATPLIKKFELGYVAGAKKVNPNIKVDSKYISQPPDFGGFKDPAKGKTIAQGMYDQGADVVYTAAGLSGTGSLQAAAAAKKWFIGVDSDQYLTASADEKPYVLTSMLKRVDNAVFNFVKGVGAGQFTKGDQRFTLKNDGVDYSKSNPTALGDLPSTLDDLKQQIISGKITPPEK
ncbi:BMP family lipoprotein [Actinoallomurus rhizosphaericola]|uniref:BMP family lipoprotein n=1 Tax=Actinoallomurus rhizosphaericola TaxID=2952536 RepID=UPI0020938F5E|nr:BMP family ABC transporter substrate-binding protein [Actinoallomurus rhizosphaericola]MCO5999213.1 BMP family ABC transporter substrate-binding protein [Actinoallomurus rhizosphaericola]